MGGRWEDDSAFHEGNIRFSSGRPSGRGKVWDAPGGARRYRSKFIRYLHWLLHFAKRPRIFIALAFLQFPRIRRRPTSVSQSVSSVQFSSVQFSWFRAPLRIPDFGGSGGASVGCRRDVGERVWLNLLVRIGYVCPMATWFPRISHL